MSPSLARASRSRAPILGASDRDERLAVRAAARTAARQEAAARALNPAAAVEPSAAFCTDSSESSAMRCAEGVASRSGDTVIIRLSSVGASKRADHPAQDAAYRR